MGQTLKGIKGGEVEVIGVEREPSAGKIASGVLNRVFVGDVEKTELPFAEGYFDCIVYGDLLEHLFNPWSLLKRHRLLLRAGGRVIASIPNIAHYRIIKMLLKNEWNYSEAGILDRDHLRFFTLKRIKEMFENAGLNIVRIERKIGASKSKKIMNLLLCNILLDKITEQYIVVAEK
jgi:SAM-dependent methyltransferase